MQREAPVTMMNLKQEFLREWKSSFPDEQAPELECFSGAGCQDVENQQAREKLEQTLAVCHSDIDRLLRELKRQNFVANFLESVLSDFDHDRSSKTFSPSVNRNSLLDAEGYSCVCHEAEIDSGVGDLNNHENLSPPLPQRPLSRGKNLVQDKSTDSLNSLESCSSAGDTGSKERPLKKPKPVPVPRRSLAYREQRPRGIIGVQEKATLTKTMSLDDQYLRQSREDQKLNKSGEKTGLYASVDPATKMRNRFSGTVTTEFMNVPNEAVVPDLESRDEDEAAGNSPKGQLQRQTSETPDTPPKVPPRDFRTRSRVDPYETVILPVLPLGDTKPTHSYSGLNAVKNSFKPTVRPKSTEPIYDEVYMGDTGVEIRSAEEEDENPYDNASPVNVDRLPSSSATSSDEEDREGYYYNIVYLNNKDRLDSESSDIYEKVEEFIGSARKSRRQPPPPPVRNTLTVPLTIHDRLSMGENPDVALEENEAPADEPARLSRLSTCSTGSSVFYPDNPATPTRSDSVKNPAFQVRPSIIREDTQEDKETVAAEGEREDVDGKKTEDRNSKSSKDEEQVMVLTPAELEKLRMRKWVVKGILDSENIYLDCLDLLIQYMKSFLAAATTTKPVISPEDIKKIFSNITALYKVHLDFVNGLKPKVENWSNEQQIGELFKLMVLQLPESGKYLTNYQAAIATLKRCSQETPQFHELTQSIKLKGIQETLSLEELLHKPVVRVQRNTLVLHDLIRCTPANHPDYGMLLKTLKLTQYFLENFEDPMNAGKDKSNSQRYLAKNSLCVEQVQNHRKLRHIFLFNDVMVCAKQKASRGQRYQFDPKWYIPLAELKMSARADEHDQEADDSQRQEVDELKTRVIQLKGEIRKELEKDVQDSSKDRHWSFTKSSAKILDKLRKKLAEQEAMLILASPNLVFRVIHNQGKTYSFLMSSDYERNAWRETIIGLQSKAPGLTNLSSYDLQSLLNSCKQLPKLNSIGSMLMREEKLDEELLSGSLIVTIHKLLGLESPCDAYCCMEVDSFGHFFMQAKTNICHKTIEPIWNEEFEIGLDGAKTLRILCYRHSQSSGEVLMGKSALELSKAWLRGDFQEKTIPMGMHSLGVSIRFATPDQTLKRTPSRMKTGLFGVRITAAVKRERSKIPILVTACIREVERRGLDELGIYRVSGVSSEIQRLKKAFDRDSRMASTMLNDVDIHAVTGLLKQYLRELPEALFTDQLYPSFVDGIGLSDEEAKQKCMVSLFSSLPEPNYGTVLYILKHLVLVSQSQHVNKMSLQNLATVYGPTLLRPAASQVEMTPIQMLTAGARDAMLQMEILLYFLTLAESGYDLTLKVSSF